MSTTIKVPIEVYTEATPNPENMKFVVNKMLLANQSAEFTSIKDAEEAPLAKAFLELDNISNVFIANNFITLAKSTQDEWYEIIPELKEFLRNYLIEGKPIFTENFKINQAIATNQVAVDDSDTVKKIKQMLNDHVRPAVEMDGGAIQFKSFENGKVTLVMQGACSGCPSSTITLKAGIEGMMKKMIPGVEEVIAEEG